jgi:acetolactate synthase-1/3 small subunit
MVEMTGPEDKLEAFVDMVRPYGIREMARTGVLAMARGKQADRPAKDEAEVA